MRWQNNLCMFHWQEFWSKYSGCKYNSYNHYKFRNLLCGILVFALVNQRNSKQNKKKKTICVKLFCRSQSCQKNILLKSECFWCFPRTFKVTVQRTVVQCNYHGNMLAGKTGFNIQSKGAVLLYSIQFVFLNVLCFIYCICPPFCSWPWKLLHASPSATWWTQQKSLLVVSWSTQW